MRKARDYDAELKALNDKARALKAQKIQRLGELVSSIGADTLDMETLAGGLLMILQESKVASVKEAWRSDGAAFFQQGRRKTKLGLRHGDEGGSETASDDPPR